MLDWSLVWVATPNGGEAHHEVVLKSANEALSRREVEADHTSRAYFRYASLTCVPLCHASLMCVPQCRVVPVGVRCYRQCQGYASQSLCGRSRVLKPA
jgi:hypothetical protein